ncbi:hypothetical protein DICPUDRAFT_91270 [Dictyostelium purpureum]|uniref:pyrroline-5-carboxylate reductase n=1 Tax=Dictyostelium purpureum TaxID=5786 RepID=F0ZA53_DICPU|nr:uncharacterized protein DICPUDRAFT_91270 [Dictyostelium purpureum]EGC39175.1 hypothetical protein DICPUDRAFT_91270 [Dictyostelium purpureum]|eukprot:XP_003284321.1 hypothetical protein DICPUDRAFT_91270 [Dictyostelium purpureum]
MVATDNKNIAILGAGNLGISIGRGIAASKKYRPNQITFTKRNLENVQYLKEEGFQLTSSNQDAVAKSQILIVAVLPAQVPSLLDSVKSLITEDHIIISVVLGLSTSDIRSFIMTDTPIVRAMPNTAIQFCESMTCIAVRSATASPADTPYERRKDHALKITEDIFNCCGQCITISEEAMVAAPALCSCGIAFFCRMIRAASSAGCEIGFHAEDAVRIAAQTAKGAAILLLQNDQHPESEIDKVTTPQGATITGLNTMEHNGLTSSIIKGIVCAAEKSAKKEANKQK